MESFLEPIVGAEIATQAVLDLRNNSDVYERRIYDETDSFAEKSAAIAFYIGRGVEPGFVTSTRRILKSESGEKRNETIGAATGYRVKELDVAKEFYYKAKGISKLIAISKESYSAAFNKYSRLVDKEIAGEKILKKDLIEKDKVNSEYRRAAKKYDKYVKEVMTLRDAAFRLGVSLNDIDIALDNAGYSVDLRDQIFYREIYPMNPKKGEGGIEETLEGFDQNQ